MEIILFVLDKNFITMARGHQKELARQRNDKGAANKPTTQKGTAGKHI
jgi:hypothetical protein